MIKAQTENRLYIVTPFYNMITISFISPYIRFVLV